MLCADWCRVKYLDAGLVAQPLLCKCWTCPECHPLRTARLVKEAKRGKPTLFITLTSRFRLDRSPPWAAQELRKAWALIRRRYVAQHGKGSIEFLAVFERTKRGWPHLHIVARAKWLDQRWLSNQMRELHGSPIVDVRRVHGLGKVAAYISKYIAKNPERFEGCKRYWRSLGYLDPEPAEPPVSRLELDAWHIVKRTAQAYVQGLSRLSYTVAWERYQYVATLWVPP